MQYDETTPRRDITVQNVVFSVIQPYVGDPNSEGYMVSGKLAEGEAHALNQTLAENFRNNFRDVVIDAIEKGEQEANARVSDALQKEMEEYMTTYSFGQRTGGIRAIDPVTAAMNELSKKIVKTRLKAQGHKLSDYTTEDLNKMAAEVRERHHDALRAKAEAAVAAETALLSDLA